MNLPFTPEQFFSVFEHYNTTVWPAQIVLTLLAVGMIVAAILKTRRSSTVVALMLGLLWLWTGIVYHIAFFAGINPAAYLFAVLCVIQALLFIWFGVIKNRLSWVPAVDLYGITGALFLLYALVVYPLLGIAFGHTFPRSPTFGLPCPTTIFTFGLLLWSERTFPKWLLPIPFLWAMIGSQAALALGVDEDTGLFVAGVLGASMLAFRKPSPTAVTASHKSNDDQEVS